MNRYSSIAFILALVLCETVSFVPQASIGRQPLLVVSAKSDDKNDDDTTSVQEDMNPVARASWYAVEVFGKVFGGKKTDSSLLDNFVNPGKVTVDLTRPPESLEETFERIQLDNDRSYFLSGEVDKLIYDEQCTFSDPFVAFDGRDRFVDNLANLGSFITKYSARMLDYTTEGTTVNTRVMVKLELNLPWKPVLAWPWGVKYSVDPDTNLITDHKESWNIEAWEVSLINTVEARRVSFEVC